MNKFYNEIKNFFENPVDNMENFSIVELSVG